MFSLASASAAIILMVGKVETSDSYCGSVLYDTQMALPCGDQMRWRRVVVVLLVAVAIGTLVLALVRGDDVRRRRVSLVIVLAITVMFLGVLLAANRLLQPAEDWCGSVLNRHRTYEPMREARCTDRLRPHLVFGIFWLWIALCGLTAAVWAAFGLRSSRD